MLSIYSPDFFCSRSSGTSTALAVYLGASMGRVSDSALLPIKVVKKLVYSLLMHYCSASKFLLLIQSFNAKIQQRGEPSCASLDTAFRSAQITNHRP